MSFLKNRIAIVGAGPIGIEAALAAQNRGYDVKVFEGGMVADSVRQWGHVRMFSPFEMNASREGIEKLHASGHELPDGKSFLTGAEFAERYLAPLAGRLGDCIHVDTEVSAITRANTGKTDKIGAPDRGETPFRILLRREDQERFENADYIFDCSGTFRTPNPLGEGGIPALGELALRDRISYGVPNVESAHGKRVLVVGGGHSAATLVRNLAGEGQKKVTWAIRKKRALPCPRIENDPLPERDGLCAEVNALAAALDFRPGTSVHSIAPNSDGLKVSLRTGENFDNVHVDHIFVATGFRPDLTLARELHLQTCWATEGTYPLAAMLLGESGGDCLSIPASGAKLLLHPEPGFFTLGMKSYGRSPDFLIRTGLQQIVSVLDWMETHPA